MVTLDLILQKTDTSQVEIPFAWIMTLPAIITPIACATQSGQLKSLQMLHGCSLMTKISRPFIK